jgi:predicted DNA repair protein MutK
MAAGGFLALLDDIAALTKIGTIKAIGVSGDDLAVKSAQVGGIPSEREIPVVLAVARGSLINKLVVLPFALLMSMKMPWAIVPVLVLGGAFLCFEAVENTLHHFQGHGKKDTADAEQSAPAQDYATFEKEKIKAAVRTDFVMSVELMMMAVGAFAGGDALRQGLSLAGVALAATLGVYGFVIALVRADDAAIHLMKKGEAEGKPFKKKAGGIVMRSLGLVLRALPVVGTVAVLAVGGGCLLKAAPGLEHLIEHTALAFGAFGFVVAEALECVAGVAGGLGVFCAVKAMTLLFKKK